MFRLGFLVSVLLLLYFFNRVLFILVNQDELSLTSWISALRLFAGGLRFDLSAIILTNLAFIVLFLTPFPFALNPIFKKSMFALFLATNGLCLLANVIDIAYFPFIHKRMQFDALLFINGKKGHEFFTLLPTLFHQYWYLALFFLLQIGFLFKAYQYGSRFRSAYHPALLSFREVLILFFAGIAIAIIGIRGGFQMKPLDIIHASEMTEVSYIPAILNTPFTMIKTMDKKRLKEVNYVPPEQLIQCQAGIHFPVEGDALVKKNVVIIIVESLSKKYLGFFSGNKQTPFLDSLFTQSLVFPNGFANAKESVQGIPAILSSIPSWQDDPFIFSPYSSNTITSFPSLLKPYGYITSFFHGGNNGTMGFDAYCSLAGFDQYYGRNEFPDDSEYDGDWGIWDEPFLQFMAQKLANTREPFFSVVFTLNTHHPFTIPEQYKSTFNEDGHPFYSCIRYADYALSRFFESAKRAPWFANTIFVITADHTAPVLKDPKTREPRKKMEPKRKKGIQSVEDYQIPIAFYSPDSSLIGIDPSIANQIDILPSVMHLLHYPDAYFSFGNNLFDPTTEKYAVNYLEGVYQYIGYEYAYQFNGQRDLGFYNWKKDPFFRHNLLQTHADAIEKEVCELKLKECIQLFNHVLIADEMTVR